MVVIFAENVEGGVGDTYKHDTNDDNRGSPHGGCFGSPHNDGEEKDTYHTLFDECYTEMCKEVEGHAPDSEGKEGGNGYFEDLFSIHSEMIIERHAPWWQERNLKTFTNSERLVFYNFSHDKDSKIFYAHQ